MSKLELGTFGAVMKFALELEAASLEFYEKMLASTIDAAFKELLERQIIRMKNRIRSLERVRRENITEMILEPIRDLNGDNYSISTFLSDIKSGNAAYETLFQIEQQKRRFYSDSAMKIEFLIEAANAFEQFADDLDTVIQEIEKHQ
ncbi:MAG: hypothetical protein ACFFD3_12820 [Candidatus Thorarchaeota archaeon]